jgi:LEA14-like dessication related protein
MKKINIKLLDKKKIFSIILILLIILNVILVLYPYTLLSTINTPETNLELCLLDINSTTACLNSSFLINNPNDFTIYLKNIKVDTLLSNGQVIAHIVIDEKQIPPKKEVEFFENIDINFQGNNPKSLHTTATGQIGIKLGFIQTNLPLTLCVETDIMDIINDVKAPVINSQVQFGNITLDSINISLILDVYNPNSFDMDVKNISISCTTESDDIVGTFNSPDVLISAQKYNQITGTGSISITALNANYLFVNITMSTRVFIAGFIKESPLNISCRIEIPDINSILTPSFPTDVIIRGDYHLSLNGLIDEIILQVRNPNNIEYAVKDIEVQIYRIDRGNRNLIGNGTIEPGIIKANTTTQLSGEVLIPYKKILLPPLGGKIIPDWLEVAIRANGTIKGLDDYMWVGMIAYQDFHLFRQDENILDNLEVWYE